MARKLTHLFQGCFFTNGIGVGAGCCCGGVARAASCQEGLRLLGDEDARKQGGAGGRRTDVVVGRKRVGDLLAGMGTGGMFWEDPGAARSEDGRARGARSV